MGVSRDVLLAALRQLGRYKGKGVDQVTVQAVNGSPVFVMHGPTPKPPDGLPGSIAVPDSSGRTVAVPVLWRNTQAGIPLIKPATRPTPTAESPDWLNTPDGRARGMPKPDEVDVDRSMWYGYTPIDRRDVATVFKPGSDHIATQQKIPTADLEDLRVAVDTTGPWGWWTKPFDSEGCLCCTFYAQPVIVFNYVVPPDYALYVDAWGILVYDQALPVGETFNIKFLRDGETLLEYDDVLVNPGAADPARRMLFSSTDEPPMHSFLRIDRNQTLTVVITPKGLFPFTKGPSDSFCATVCCLLHGHLQALLDNRDGTPRPRDVGRIRDDLWGTGALRNVTKDDVEQLYAWMTAASANSFPSTDPQKGTEPSPPAAALPAPAQADPASAASWGIVAAIVAASALGDQDVGSSVSPNPLP